MLIKKISKSKNKNTRSNIDNDFIEFMNEIESLGISPENSNHITNISTSYNNNNINNKNDIGITFLTSLKNNNTITTESKLTTATTATIKIKSNEFEFLFWLIFRNLFLRNLILSKIKLLKNYGYDGCGEKDYLKYDEIVDVEWMISNGYLNLIKYKVERGDNLIFKPKIKSYGLKNNNNNNNNNNSNNLINNHSIFNIFKNDKSFFKNLFLKYPYLITLPMKSVNKLKSKLLTQGNNESENENYSKMVKIGLEYDNLALIQLLIQDYSCNLFYNSFEYALLNGSFNVAKYLYQSLKIELNSQNQRILWKKLLVIGSKGGDTLKLMNKIVCFLYDDLKIKQQSYIENQNINFGCGESLFDFNIFNETLESIMECCFTIAYLKPKFENYIQTFKDKKSRFTNYATTNFVDDLLSEEYTILTVEQLNEIKSKFQTNEVGQFICEFSNENNEIKQLFNMLIVFTSLDDKKKKMFNNYSFYKAKYFKKYYTGHYLYLTANRNSIYNTDETIIFKPYLFGDFVWGKKKNVKFANGKSETEDGGDQDFIEHLFRNGENYEMFTLLSYCSTKDNLKSSKYIKRIFQTLNQNQDKYARADFYTGAIKFSIVNDSIDYLNLASDIFKDVKCTFAFFSTRFVHQFKSVLLFDQVYKLFPIKIRNFSFREHSIQEQFNSLIHHYLTGKPEFLNHIAITFPNYYLNCVSSSLFSIDDFEVSIYLIKFLFSNWINYHDNLENQKQIKSILSHIFQYLPKDTSFLEWVWIINNKPKCLDNNLDNQFILPSYLNNKIEKLEYFYNNFNQQFNLNYFTNSNIPNNIQLLFNIKIKNLNEQNDQEREIIIQFYEELLFKNYSIDIIISTLYKTLIKNNLIFQFSFLITKLIVNPEYIQQQDQQKQQEPEYNFFKNNFNLFFDLSLKYCKFEILKFLIYNFKFTNLIDKQQLFDKVIKFGNFEILDIIIKEFEINEINIPFPNEKIQNHQPSNNFFYTFSYLKNNHPYIKIIK